MIGLPCKCAALAKLSNGTNVALICIFADFVEMVFAQDLKTAALPQTITFKRLCATTNNPQPSVLHNIVLTRERCVQ
jgi:hypothetical protein